MRNLIIFISIFILLYSYTKPPSERYFFVGYIINNGTTGGVLMNTNNGLLPIKKDLYDYLKQRCQSKSFAYADLIVLSISEFKNKQDRDYFLSNFMQNDTAHVHKFDLCLKCNAPGCGCWCVIDECLYFQEVSTHKIFPSKDSAILYLKKNKKIL